MKRFIIAFIAAYIFLFVWGWLLNGVLLKDIYAQTPNLWRTQTEMLSFFHWILIGQALIVFAFVMIYVAGFAGGGIAVSYTHLRAHETPEHLVCRLLLE